MKRRKQLLLLLIITLTILLSPINTKASGYCYNYIVYLGNFLTVNDIKIIKYPMLIIKHKSTNMTLAYDNHPIESQNATVNIKFVRTNKAVTKIQYLGKRICF